MNQEINKTLGEKNDIYKFTDIEKQYIKEINTIPLLTYEEEEELIYKMSHGDESARNKLIKHNLRLVVSIAKKYIKSRIEFLDLVEVGNEGLITAIDKFELSKKCKLSTYASIWIQSKIRRYIKENKKSVYIPIHVTDAITEYKRQKEQIMKQLFRVPSYKELSERLDIPESEIIDYEKFSASITSLNSHIGDDKDDELIDFIQSDEKTPEEIIVDLNLKEKIKQLFYEAKLTDKEITILILRYGFDNGREKTLEEVGQMFKVTRENIKRIEASALRKLRISKFTRQFADYQDKPETALENLEIYKELYKNPNNRVKALDDINEIKRSNKK